MENQENKKIQELERDIYSLECKMDEMDEKYDGWLISNNLLKRILAFSGYTILATLFFYFILFILFIIFIGLIFMIELF